MEPIYLHTAYKDLFRTEENILEHSNRNVKILNLFKKNRYN